jgi:hypothetical protein
MKELREEARERGISFTGLNRKQLEIALGEKPEGAVVYSHRDGLTKDDIESRKEKGHRIPTNTIYWEKDEEKINQVWEKNPEAFDNYDFTDENQRLQIRFERKVTCTCGEKFVIGRNKVGTRKTRDGSVETVVDRNPRYDEDRNYSDQQLCPGCGRNYIFIDPEKIEEVAV